jgi:hypothetical protein
MLADLITIKDNTKSFHEAWALFVKNLASEVAGLNPTRKKNF